MTARAGHSDDNLFQTIAAKEKELQARSEQAREQARALTEQAQRQAAALLERARRDGLI